MAYIDLDAHLCAIKTHLQHHLSINQKYQYFTIFSVCRVAALKSLPVHSLNALIIPILRGCLQSLFNIPAGYGI